MTVRVVPSIISGIVSIPPETNQLIQMIEKELPGEQALFIEGIAMNDEISNYLSKLQEAGKSTDLSRDPYSAQQYTLAIRGNLPRIKLSIAADFSLAAPWICMAALGCNLTVSNLCTDSRTDDAYLLSLLEEMGVCLRRKVIGMEFRSNGLSAIRADLSGYDNLLPYICALSAVANGISCITFRRNQQEQDELFHYCHEMLESIGCDVAITDDSLMIRGKQRIDGGIIDTHDDGRIALAAIALSAASAGDMIISHPQSIDRIYPSFWTEYQRCGGNVL